MPGLLKVAKVVKGSKVDGPGLRTVVFFQGCSVRCPDCGNRELWDPHGECEVYTPSGLCLEIAGYNSNYGEGLTLSGGEPTEQPKDKLLTFLRMMRLAHGVGSIIIFTGRWLEHLEMKPWFRKLRQEGLVDVLVDGPYVAGLNNGSDQHGLGGSSNQRIHLLTDRHQFEEFLSRGAQVELHPDGRVTIRGFPDRDMTGAVKCCTSSPAPTAV